jgi:DNA invertase Pin-like site-specific DNA recombinase
LGEAQALATLVTPTHAGPPKGHGRSVTDLLAILQDLEHLGVGFVSLTEALDQTASAGRAMAGLLAVVAEFGREILRELVRAGLAHSRENGQRLGRPLTAALYADQFRELQSARISKAEILLQGVYASFPKGHKLSHSPL